jgi:hypothetical protein
MKARQVLADARAAISLASLAMDHASFRLHWAAAVALLRAVGHVLEKADACSSPAFAKANREWWAGVRRDRADHPIFWNFIKAERDNILKEYAFGYAEDAAEITSTGFDSISVPYHMPIQDGPFKGHDSLDVAERAVQWWEAQLNIVESTARTGAA